MKTDPKSSHHRIVIADDNLGLLASMQARLEHEGYEVHTSQDGYQAVAMARRVLPHLILLDINMPAGSGFSVHERLKAIPELHGVSVLYMTGIENVDVYEAAEQLGGIAVLQKPFEADELVHVVRSCIDHAEQRVVSS